MKKCIVLILCVMLLCGCKGGNSEINSAMELRQKMLSAGGCEFDCTITADDSVNLYTFTLQCSYEKDKILKFTVKEPESIQGITGYFDSEGGKLTFDDQMLAFPMLADGQISPVSTPWLFIKCLCYGYIRGVGEDNGQNRIMIQETYEDNTLQADIWTDQNNIPISCEFLWQGRRILSMEIINFTLL